MTTLVANREYMAADSQLTCDGIALKTKKLFRGPDGSVLGIYGAWTHAMAMVDYLSGRVDTTPTFDDDYDWGVLWLRRDGIYIVEESARLVPAGVDKHATGSGGGIALGALFMGASPEQAVKAACQYDVMSGGRIQTMAIQSPKPKRKK